MKVSISSRDLEILRKAVYGLSHDQIANELRINAEEVQTALKHVLKNTQSKEPLQAMQILAKNGFVIAN
jgi:DNA-binding NarL/FixJ family response regulator